MTAKITRLETRFNTVKGCKTRTGAEGHIQSFIITTDSGQYLPVVILSEDVTWMMHYAITCGLCVTN